MVLVANTLWRIRSLFFQHCTFCEYSSELFRHVKEHLKGRLNLDEGMSADSVKFHYFRMYDVNKDARLDGTEIIKAVTHSHADAAHPTPNTQFSDEDLERIVDRTLASQDVNNDGYIDFAEFINSRP
ncbi:EF-hand 7 domain containing protein [Trichuris trichiura]|uniref:EF-hand 7 domain containing protein n=1 Tax=Trichuris trichiura TaxID=36087 RepID=A0A077ZE17_TRITR|nr:EF-hand 7 domain containing protein [Trichuris trichiura]